MTVVVRSFIVMLCLTLGAAGMVTPVVHAQDKDWPQFRGPTGQGLSTSKGLPLTWSQKENLAWKVELPGSGASTPIIVGDRVFVTCYSGFGLRGAPAGATLDQLKLHVVCLNRADGKIRWTKEVEPKLPELATIRENHGYASNTPAADSERLYVFFGKSGVLAFDHDGKQLWRTSVGEKAHESWGTGASLTLHGDLVFVNASIESDSLVALDKKTGKEMWRAKGIKESWNTPVLVTSDQGKTELVVASQGKLLGFEPTTGEALWSCKTDIGWYMVPSVVAHDGIVYCLGGRSGIVGLAVKAGGRGDVTKTHRLWTTRTGSNVSSPVFHQGHLYWMSDVKEAAFCADAKTGTVVYEKSISRIGEVYSAAVLTDGKIYYLSRGGQTVVVAAEPQFKELARNDLRDGTTFNSSPAVAGDQMFVRSGRFLYCVARK